jgi:hypothetical protein
LRAAWPRCEIASLREFGIAERTASMSAGRVASASPAMEISTAWKRWKSWKFDLVRSSAALMLISLVPGLMREWFSPTPFSPLSVQLFTVFQKSESSRPMITSALDTAVAPVLR